MEANLEYTRNLHSKFARLLGVRGFSMSRSIRETSQLIPPAVLSGPANVKSVTVTSGMHGSQPIFSYEVKWTEKETELLPKKSSSTVVGKIRCEGPCKKVVDLSTTVQFGCDHAICSKCRQTAQSITLFDGSPGCCNEKCVKTAKLSGEKICVGPTDSAQCLTSAQNDAIESIQCHVAILKNGGNHIIRVQNDLEFPSSARVSTLLKSLAHFKEVLKDARFYYCDKKPKNRHEMNQIALLDTHLRFRDLVDLAVSHDIYFLIVSNRVRLI